MSRSNTDMGPIKKDHLKLWQYFGLCLKAVNHTDAKPVPFRKIIVAVLLRIDGGGLTN